MITPADAGRRLPYSGALDGLRAFAVLAVLFYHIDSPWSQFHVRGGFFGVDVFFVLSGYLITSMLLAEWGHARIVSVSQFWVRRARRLLPAVIVLLGAVLLYALLFLPNEVASLRRDALASLVYVTNWYLIFHNESYFESWGRPSLFQHLWSLAIEEQFYILWPLVFLLGMRFLRRTGLLIASLAAATAATVAMALLYQPGVDPSRLYYGTDTRSAGLLIGSALALVLPATSAARDRRLGHFGGLIGLVGLGVLAYFFVRVGDTSALPYRGGFAIVSLATAAIIVSTIGTRSRLSGALAFGPLRWIGKRSYSIYLWHWPVLMLTRPGLDIPFGGWPLFVLRIAIIALLAEISYRFVETPIRTGAVQRTWALWRERYGGAALRRTGLALAAAAMAAVAAVTVALWQAEAPAPLSSSSSIGMDVPVAPAGGLSAEAPPARAKAASAQTLPEVTSTAEPSEVHAPVLQPTARCTDVYTPGHRAESCAQPTPEPSPEVEIAAQEVTLPHVTAIGDSVMLGAAPQLQAALAPADVHAEVGLQVSAGNDILRQLQAAGTLGDIVVIHLGTNGEFNDDQLAEMMAELKDTRLVVFVNLKVPRPWEENNNHMLEDAVRGYPNARLIDWHAKSEHESEYFWNDGIHLRPEGALVYAGLILGEIRSAWPELAAPKTP